MNENEKDILEIPVTSYRRIATPFEEEGKSMYVAVVRVKDLPKKLESWRRINPRDPSLKTAVAKSIAQSLKDSPSEFFFKNRGITTLVEKATYDNSSDTLSLTLSNPEYHGLLDGGHTFSIIQNIFEGLSSEDSEKLGEAYVRVEILEGFSNLDDVVNIVGARNTSTQVKDQSIEELQNHFEPIKNILKDHSYANRIAYKETEINSDGSKKDLDIREILSYLICFDLEEFGQANHPIIAYSSKSAVLKHVKSSYSRLEKYYPLLPEILEFKDHIYAELPSVYNKEIGSFGKLTGVMSLHEKKKEIELPFSKKKSKYSIPSSFIYPILAAFRNVVIVDKENGECTWKEPPAELFDRVKTELVQIITDQAKEYRNPNKLGKDRATWKMCNDTIRLALMD